MATNLQAIRSAIEQAKVVAEEFRSGTITFYNSGNPTPVFSTSCRLRKPKPSSFDASNQTEWSTKRLLVAKVPLEIDGVGVIRKGMVAQVSTPDGDPSINLVSFTVQSAMTSQFAAEREVTLATELNETPRVT